MATTLVGLVGWRGMVGSVLMDRMQAEGDFALIEPLFFSTSNAGGKAPSMAKNETTLKDAFSIEDLKRCVASVRSGCAGGLAPARGPLRWCGPCPFSSYRPDLRLNGDAF